jgi:hypothetical protein
MFHVSFVLQITIESNHRTRDLCFKPWVVTLDASEALSGY